MNVSEVTKLIVAKSKEAPATVKKQSKAAAMYWASSELWTDEYAAWRAIANSSLGPLSSAAECAWERRTAYFEANGLLLEAWLPA
jgi:hypothetical protein